jgi:excinuclease UvrABC nuclease subunit
MLLQLDALEAEMDEAAEHEDFEAAAELEERHAVLSSEVADALLSLGVSAAEMRAYSPKNQE